MGIVADRAFEPFKHFARARFPSSVKQVRLKAKLLGSSESRPVKPRVRVIKRPIPEIVHWIVTSRDHWKWFVSLFPVDPVGVSAGCRKPIFWRCVGIDDFFKPVGLKGLPGVERKLVASLKRVSLQVDDTILTANADREQILSLTV